ncbi:tRNA dimethylallyltransferase 2 isoform X1 [Morus notabilis]|nr:tRNA dimethylallyltransferase 2 isoform X1 [Morus notabilis]XP_024019271.1 tRNA dimethylallyltransferase 2 isoform X1 [Morus notabilis]XP_024019272.1 tRNA dimethylallyltransferase 2 isoform X1 [Morus notabilis]XP_024019273.1 tRNA dimethylallyltransferase 2 isoform X1 [Morus notabilis]
MKKIRNPSNGEHKPKPKVVVIMGPTGSGKSRLAIDLGSHFPVEVINADSMQVYRGLDVLTNKVPLDEQKGILHHLLGAMSPNVEFTAKEFRDSAIPNADFQLIDDILSRNCLPVIVGGTNYYIQALISPFLLDDTVEDMDDNCSSISPGDAELCCKMDDDRRSDSYNHLKSIDPIAANRIHPNNHRKINQYLSLYARSGILPSELLQGKAVENWGKVDNFRYNCCFICMDASLPVLDQYVEQRVDCMVDAGLLNEVYDIFNVGTDYTQGLLQAIGVREFQKFLRDYIAKDGCNHEIHSTDASVTLKSVDTGDNILKENMRVMLKSPYDCKPKILLKEAIDKVKLNTRRLIRRQRRRIIRLQKLFGWDIHFMDATESILSKSDDIWAEQVVEPATKIVRSFLDQEVSSMPGKEAPNDTRTKLLERGLWTQYICKACGDRVLRGAHEWEQHKQGRSHRRRILKLRKSQGLSSTEQLQQPEQN